MFDDLTTPEAAYIVGLLQTDGHHEGDIGAKGKVALELADRDAVVLEEISELLPCYSSVRYRTRTTNFSTNYRTATSGFFDQTTRRALVRRVSRSALSRHRFDRPAFRTRSPTMFEGCLMATGRSDSPAAGCPSSAW